MVGVARWRGRARLAAFAVLMAVIGSCERASAPTARDRFAVPLALDATSLGSFHIPIAANNDSNSGALVATSTGLKFPDSGAVQVTVTGQVTVTPNSNWTCCFSDNLPADNKAGSYGPNGIAPDLQVSLPTFSTSLHPSGAGATTIMTDTIGDVRSDGLNGTTLTVARSGIAGASSCAGAAGAPPNCKCPSGVCASYSSGRWLLSSAQTVTMNLITDSYVLTANRSTVIAGQTVTFTASTKSGTAIAPSSTSWNFVFDAGGGANYCLSGNPCTQPVAQSGTMTVTGKLLGMTKSASVHVSVLCPPDSSKEKFRDSLIRNSTKLINALDSVEKLGQNDGLEHLANLYHDSQGDTDVVVYVAVNSSNTPCGVAAANPGEPGSYKLVGRAHDHPALVPAGTCAAFPKGGNGTDYPSPGDDAVTMADQTSLGYPVPNYDISPSGIEETNWNSIIEHNYYRRQSSTACHFP